MEQDDNPELTEEVQPEVVPPRGKRPMTQKQQEALAVAREKAWARRKELADISGKEKELTKKMKLLALKKRKQKVEKRLAKLENDEDSSEGLRPLSTRRTTHRKEADEFSHTSSSSSSSEEEVVIRPKHKNRVEKINPPQRKQSTMGEGLPHNPRREGAETLTEVTREMLKEKMLRESQRIAFASLFPNKPNPF